MDKNQQEVLNGLIHSIEDLKARLVALEGQVAAFRDAMAAEPAPEPVVAAHSDDEPIDLSMADIGVIDIPAIIPVIEEVPEPEPVAEPELVAEPEPVAADLPEAEPEVVDLPEPMVEEIPEQVRNDVEELRNDVEPEPDDLPEPELVAEPEPVAADLPGAEPELVDLPAPEPVAEPEPEPIAAPEPEPAPVAKGKSLVDLAAEKLAWKTDFPGIRVKNIRSAISLMDRALFIGKLFGEDFALYDKTITELNEAETLDEAVQYVTGHFPDWDLKSDLVYSFMMAIRKKLG